MDAEREFINVGALAAEVEDTDLWVGDTSIKARLRVWLSRHIKSVYIRAIK